MDLTPLYDLRERLKSGAVAGTGLLAEDFRLQRSLQNFVPLEGASPVFAKLAQGVRALLAPDCPDRAAALLDALALADAVLCTQAAVSVSEEMQPLSLSCGGSALTNAPYSVLSPLMEALTTSGSGRYSFVIDTRSQHPELFADYRVKHALVAALGAPYSELAEQVKLWLSEEDETILPLLMEGFDPKGKKDMVRRLCVIEAVAGPKADDFYHGLLETAEKEVRGAAIYALRHREENAALLVTLAKTEKGAAKKQAHWALAKLESQEAWTYWETVMKKKPDQVAEYMALSTTKKASDLIGSSLCALLAPFEEGKGQLTKELAAQLQQLLQVLPGKSGPEICNFFIRAAKLGNMLDQPLEGEKKPVLFSCAEGYRNIEDQVFSKALPLVLNRCLLLYPALDLLALSEKLDQAYGSLWAIPAMTAAFLTKSGEEAFQIGQKFLSSILKKKEHKSYLERELSYLRYQEEEKRLELTAYFVNPQSEMSFQSRQPLAAPLDPRWYPEIIKLGGDQENLLIQLIQPDNPEVCRFLIAHFYQRTLTSSGAFRYLEPLKKLGCRRCDGLAAAYCQNQKNLAFYTLRNFIVQMPGDNQAKAAETERLVKLAEGGKLSLRTGEDLQSLRQLVLELQNSPGSLS